MNTAAIQDIPGTEEAWDNGLLGEAEQYVAVSNHSTAADIDSALSLQPISIRLQKGLIDNLKMIAETNSIGYQPLIRQVLTRFVDGELKQIALDALATQLKEQQPEQDAGIAPRQRA